MLKRIKKTAIATTALIAVAFAVQSFIPAPTSLSPTKWYVETNAKCRNGNCRCSGYKGIKHQNGTYEGPCRNTDGHGHTCGHGPEKHGLRKY